MRLVECQTVIFQDEVTVIVFFFIAVTLYDAVTETYDMTDASLTELGGIHKMELK